MSVHTNFQHNPLKNKARGRVLILENWGFSVLTVEYQNIAGFGYPCTKIPVFFKNCDQDPPPLPHVR